jgi:cell division protein FtsA
MVNDGFVVGLDIGSTKVCAILGEKDESGLIEITGVGVSPSTGLRKGIVINIEAVLHSVQSAIEAAEMMSGKVITICYSCIGGTRIRGLDSRGVVAVTGKNREISVDDVNRVLEAASAVAIPMDREVLEVIPQSFTVDDNKGIADPLDMIGVRLEAEVHIITYAVTGAQNLIKCVNRAGFRVTGLVLNTLAGAASVLGTEEKELGCVLIDLGGGTTDVLIYQNGAVFSTFTIPVGGSQVTNDISVVKNIALETAEKIKIDFACCAENFLNENDEDMVVPLMGGRSAIPVSRYEIYSIVRPRMEELFSMVKAELDKLLPSRAIGGGIVLIGGGALLEGSAELASSVFGVPVRLGEPGIKGGLIDEYRNPSYATAIGLVMEGFAREDGGGNSSGGLTGGKPDKYDNNKGNKNTGVKTNIVSKAVQWLKKEFF